MRQTSSGANTSVMAPVPARQASNARRMGLSVGFALLGERFGHSSLPVAWMSLDRGMIAMLRLDRGAPAKRPLPLGANLWKRRRRYLSRPLLVPSGRTDAASRRSLVHRARRQVRYAAAAALLGVVGPIGMLPCELMAAMIARSHQHPGGSEHATGRGSRAQHQLRRAGGGRAALAGPIHLRRPRLLRVPAPRLHRALQLHRGRPSRLG